MSDLPDVLPDAKAWLQSLQIVGNRVFFRLPSRPSNSPFIRISRSGGGPQPNAEVGVTQPRVTVEIWGLMDTDYEAVRGAALAIEQACHDVNRPTPIGSTETVLLGANVLSTFDSPDPDTGWPRIIMSLALDARTA